MIETYRTNLEAFHGALCREKYRHYSGLKESLELSAIYSEYSDLYKRETIAELKQLKKKVAPHHQSLRKSHHRFLGFALERQVESQTLELTQSIATATAQASLRWDGRDIGYYETFSILVNEEDAERRRELYHRRREAVSSLRSDRLERLRSQVQSAKGLGFDSYLGLCSFIKRLDYNSLARLAKKFLSNTRGLFYDHLTKTLRRELGMERSEAHRCDIPFFQRQPSFDDHFPASRLLFSYAETLDGLGIDLRRQPNLHIDKAIRPRKHPQAFCAPVVIPQEVRLVIPPRGGHGDYAAFLHEGGHSQHYAWTSPQLPIENRCCGDAALSEIYAFLFNYLMCDGGWLQVRLGFSQSTRFNYLQSLFRLYMIRRYAAKVVFEVLLQGDPEFDDGTISTRYRNLLTSATGFRFDEEDFLEDLDDGLYAADYFRAWIVEAQLEELLRERYGRQWYVEPKAGNLLKEIWETGELYTVDELSSELGLQSGDIEPLESVLRDALRYDDTTR